jgi:hypothetical protein
MSRSRRRGAVAAACVAALAALATACSDPDGGPDGPAPAAGSASRYAPPLKGVCPDPVVVQRNWWPDAPRRPPPDPGRRPTREGDRELDRTRRWAVGGVGARSRLHRSRGGPPRPGRPPLLHGGRARSPGRPGDRDGRPVPHPRRRRRLRPWSRASTPRRSSRIGRCRTTREPRVARPAPGLRSTRLQPLLMSRVDRVERPPPASKTFSRFQGRGKPRAKVTPWGACPRRRPRIPRAGDPRGLRMLLMRLTRRGRNRDDPTFASAMPLPRAGAVLPLQLD